MKVCHQGFREQLKAPELKRKMKGKREKRKVQIVMRVNTECMRVKIICEGRIDLYGSK